MYGIMQSSGTSPEAGRSMLRVERYVPKFYPYINNWYEQNGERPPPECHLSQTGVVATLDDAPVAAAFGYETNSSICYYDHFVVSPEVRRGRRRSVVDVMFTALQDLMQGLGFTNGFVCSRNASITNHLARNGFEKKGDVAFMEAAYE